MTDTYQAIYDAVRSRISNGDIGCTVATVIQDMNIGHYFMMAGQSFCEVAFEQSKPSAIYRPTLKIDGNKWCALYGDNLQDGVAGFGDSPAEAMADFDKRWQEKLS